jgi:hypothetical protein
LLDDIDVLLGVSEAHTLSKQFHPKVVKLYTVNHIDCVMVGVFASEFGRTLIPSSQSGQNKDCKI